VKNYDILVGTVAVTAVGALALIADLGLRMMWFGGGRRRDSNSSGVGGIIALLAIVFLVLAPFVAQLMQFAMSRKRELLADASGVQLTRYPPGLISALEKLKGDQAVVHHATRATAQLWIESPLDRDHDHKRTRLNRAFDTHPPLDERIRILKEM
jgi:heat shock protein HtpX